MSVDTVSQRQLRRIVDRAVATPFPVIPPLGWLQTVRKALGMTGVQLATRMKVTRGRIAQADRLERTGAATIKSMRAMAEAMGCKFVYAIVPPEPVDDFLLTQARKKAAAIVQTASKHMALENQVLSKDKINEQIEELARELIQKPSDLWND